MSFLGKDYVLDSQENFEGFVESFGKDATDDFKKALINHKGTIRLTKDGDQYSFSATQPGGGTKLTQFKNGQEFEEDVKTTTAKATITVSGNTMTHVQKFPNGVVFTTKREFSDDQVVVTITSTGWNGTAKRFYKAA